MNNVITIKRSLFVLLVLGTQLDAMEVDKFLPEQKEYNVKEYNINKQHEHAFAEHLCNSYEESIANTIMMWQQQLANGNRKVEAIDVRYHYNVAVIKLNDFKKKRGDLGIKNAGEYVLRKNVQEHKRNNHKRFIEKIGKKRKFAYIMQGAEMSDTKKRKIE